MYIYIYIYIYTHTYLIIHRYVFSGALNLSDDMSKSGQATVLGSGNVADHMYENFENV